MTAQLYRLTYKTQSLTQKNMTDLEKCLNMVKSFWPIWLENAEN